jgi:hypothetical protein
MTTLISAYNSDGCIGRCDAKCHNATGPDCYCICGGRNHGVGVKQAYSNTREMAADQIEETLGKDARVEFDRVTKPMF